MTKNSKQLFYANNRAALRRRLRKNKDYQELAVITGHSMIQGSADTALPFVQDSSFFYLTGLEISGIILVIDNDDEYLIVPDFDEVKAAFEGSVDVPKIKQISGIKTVLTYTKGWEELTAWIKDRDNVAVLAPIDSYIERHDMFANPSRKRVVDQITAIKQGINYIDARPDLAAMRMVKSDYEVRMIELAIARTKELFDIIEDLRSTVVNERELFAAITAHRIKAGLVDAYEPIIAGGRNAVTLHYVQNNAPLNENELLLLDIGLKYEGYSADITRTVVSRPTKRQKQVYDAVLEVQAYALSLLKPNLSFKDYETKVRDYTGTKLIELGLITEANEEAIRKYYPHSTSHFMGIDVHDVGDYWLPLQAGVVMTVEPGIYIPEEGIGIRIEDDVLITNDGYRLLSCDLPKNISSLTIEGNS